MPSNSSKIDEEDFTVILPDAMKPLQVLELQKVLTLEQYCFYTYWVYSAQNTSIKIIDPSGIYPRIHFLAGREAEDVTKCFLWLLWKCYWLSWQPRNSWITYVHHRSSKKVLKCSRSDIVVLKFLTASPEVHPVPALSWIIVQLCTRNKTNLNIGKNKQLQHRDVNLI